jgi:hypothetical protein
MADKNTDFINKHYDNLIEKTTNDYETTKKNIISEKFGVAQTNQLLDDLKDSYNTSIQNLKEERIRGLENPKETAISIQLDELEKDSMKKYAALAKELLENKEAYQKGEISHKKYKEIKKGFDEKFEKNSEDFKLHAAAIKSGTTYEQAKSLQEELAPVAENEKSFRDKVNEYKTEVSERMSKDRMWAKTKSAWKSTSKYFGKTIKAIGDMVKDTASLSYNYAKETKAAKTVAFSGKVAAVAGYHTGKVVKALVKKSVSSVSNLNQKFTNHRAAVLTQNRLNKGDNAVDLYAVALASNLGAKFKEKVNKEFADSVTPAAVESYENTKKKIKEFKEKQNAKEPKQKGKDQELGA